MEFPLVYRTTGCECEHNRQYDAQAVDDRNTSRQIKQRYKGQFSPSQNRCLRMAEGLRGFAPLAVEFHLQAMRQC